VTIPSSVTSIEWGGFHKCTGLTRITIPGSVYSIENMAFFGCANLVVINMQDGITNLRYGSFEGCTNLTTVTIPASVSSIEFEAFGYCLSLKKVSFMGDAPTMGTDVFVSADPGFTVHYRDVASGFTSPEWLGYPSAIIRELPTIEIPTCANISATTATLGGLVTYNGGVSVSTLGVVYAATMVNSNPRLGGVGVVNVINLTGAGASGEFVVDVTNLMPGTAYSYVAYATNLIGTGYTTAGTFTTLSSNAGLVGLALNSGTLVPAFNVDCINYTGGVTNATSTITVAPTPAQLDATITVNGSEILSGGTSDQIALMVGPNSITIIVTAQDKITTRTYTVTVIRHALPTVTAPTSASVTALSALLGGNVASDGFATVAERGVVFARTAENSNPQLGGAGVINIAGSGTTGVFAVGVTGLMPATDYSYAAYAINSEGTSYSATATFTTPSSDADLSSLTLSAIALNPAFASGTVNYRSFVSNTTTSLTVVPTVVQGNAAVKVNNIAVSSGTTSTPISLGYGDNPITITVTAQDNITSKSYLVVVNRAAPSPLTASFNAASEVPLTTNGFNATGSTVNLALNFTPAPGTVLRVVNNTALNFISGEFRNLAQGQVVPLSYNGATFTFVANYYGGTGNDLVLQWTNTAPMAWGANSYGTLGNNRTTNSLLPTAVSTTGVLTSKIITAVAAGASHSLALCSDGSLAAWGDNSSGQLGNNSTIASNLPVAVNSEGVLAGRLVIAISAGNAHSLALCSDGTVAAWGDNSVGQLGNSSTVPSRAPVAVDATGVLAGRSVVAISAGNAHCLALCADGGIVTWGDNFAGQLGNDSTTFSLVPVEVSTAGAIAGRRIVAIAAGNAHSLAICSDDKVVAWGDNTYGQLGNGNNLPSGIPLAVSTSGVLAGKSVVGIAAGSDHSLALCSNGALAAWGWNGEGELGNNTITDSNVPVVVVATGVLLNKTVVAVSAGASHSLALSSDGTITGWGFNGDGAVGNNSTANRRVPTTVSMTQLPAGSRFMFVRSGSVASHSLAIAATPATPPTALTDEATNITSSAATLFGVVNPNGSATEVYFNYGPTTSYGTITPVQSLPSGITAVTVTAPITGLSPNGTYHYQIVATNAGGTVSGLDETFQTLAAGTPTARPSVTTGSPTDITTLTATLHGTVNPNGGITNGFFEYGTSTSYGSVTSNLGAGSGNTPASVSAGITGLLPGTLYHYRLVAVNSLDTTHGADASFTTLFLPPTAVVGGSVALSTTAVRVSGTVHAHRASTLVSFEYGTDGVSFPNSVTAAPATVSGDIATAVSADLPNLLQTKYYYRLRAESVGGTSRSEPAFFQVAILSGLAQVFPGPPPASTGKVTVTSTPSGMASGWRFVGEQQWRESGTQVTGLENGDRQVEFRPVPGYIQPLRESVVVDSTHQTVTFEGNYYETPAFGTGGVSITLKPDSVAATAVPSAQRAQWRFLGENDLNWRDSGTTVSGLPPGTYYIESKAIAGRATPPPASIHCNAGETMLATITYYVVDAQTGTLPSVVDVGIMSGDQTMPYAYIGQIQSEVGSSSGFIVKPRVVATAGHVVFDDWTLSAVLGLQWLLQRDAGTFEPKPHIPRGFYSFDGYAAQRISDKTPGSSSPQSQNLDAAAIYFNEEAGRGGYGGFLASDLDNNEFLLSAAQKMLVGYPVDGISAANQGRMHATPPANIPFTKAFGHTYATSSVRSSGGGSGGPLCIQHQNGTWYPAAIYLGGSGQTVVRSIDSQLIELFKRAETSSVGGANNTGGGISHTSVTGILNPTMNGALRVQIEPAAARSYGAGWRLRPETTFRPSIDTYGNVIQKGSLAPGIYTLEFTTVPGFQPPASQTVEITGGQVITVDFSYTVNLTALEIWRGENFGTLSNTGPAADGADPDADGQPNLAEFAAGTNPNSAAEVFKVLTEQMTGGTFSVTADGKKDRSYSLQRCLSLTAGNWDTVVTLGPLADDGSTVSLTDPAAPVGKAFYRIQVSAP
jgi:alpha-tubulin suppressor-like RCC1 family protein